MIATASPGYPVLRQERLAPQGAAGSRLRHRITMSRVPLDTGRTVVAVLHDLNQAARFATHLVCMRDGRIVTQCRPEEVMDAELVHETFGMDCRIITDPESKTPLVIPRNARSRHHVDLVGHTRRSAR